MKREIRKEQKVKVKMKWEGCLLDVGDLGPKPQNDPSRDRRPTGDQILVSGGECLLCPSNRQMPSSGKDHPLYSPNREHYLGLSITRHLMLNHDGNRLND